MDQSGDGVLCVLDTMFILKARWHIKRFLFNAFLLLFRRSEIEPGGGRIAPTMKPSRMI